MIQIANSMQKKILTTKSNQKEDKIIKILRTFASKEKTI